MPVAEIHVNLFDLVSSLAKTADMISPEVADHHMRVAYIAFRIAQHLDWPPEQRRELVMAGALHDIGAFSLQERLNLLEFEYVNPGQHARAGYLLLSTFKPFQGIANIIHYHHLPWGNGKGASKNGRLVPLGSHILNLADRVAILLTRDEPPLTQVEHIMRAIEHQRGRVFKPELVDALLSFMTCDSRSRSGVGSSSNRPRISSFVDESCSRVLATCCTTTQRLATSWTWFPNPPSCSLPSR